MDRVVATRHTPVLVLVMGMLTRLLMGMLTVLLMVMLVLLMK